MIHWSSNKAGFKGNHKHFIKGTFSYRYAVGVLAHPIFTGAIPDVTGNEGDPNITTDLSGYFTGATSYSISPAVEAGWNFDTVTGILTVDTDEANTFGPYVVTGTNLSGSDDSNAFSVVISTLSAAKGGYAPAKIIKTRLKKRDEEILEQVYELVAQLEEVPKTKKLIDRAKKIEVKAKKAIQLKDYTEQNRQIATINSQIDKLSTAVTLHIKAVKEDEEQAVKALLEII